MSTTAMREEKSLFAPTRREVCLATTTTERRTLSNRSFFKYVKSTSPQTDGAGFIGMVGFDGSMATMENNIAIGGSRRKTGTGKRWGGLPICKQKEIEHRDRIRAEELL